ncbi:hypothetical protein ALT721_2410022 [Alteromonas alvinellae]
MLTQNCIKRQYIIISAELHYFVVISQKIDGSASYISTNVTV